jgi:hypothetical protein
LNHKYQDQKIADASPNQIGFWSKDFDFIHNSIFAFSAKNRVGL